MLYIGHTIPPLGNQLKHILIIFVSTLLLTSPLISQSERPETIIIPVSSMGDVSDTRKKIIQNTLTQELSKHFQILPKDRFEQVQEQVFIELEYDECTEDQCIMRIQEILQIENLFHLEVIGEEGDTQLNLKWVNLDEKRNREDYCEGCKTKELRKRVVELVEKLVGKGVVEKSVVIVEKKPAEVVEKRQKGVLFQHMVNGRWGWYEDGDEDKDYKYVGEIENGKPNGQGTLTYSDGTKYVGEFKYGVNQGQGTLTFPDGSKKVGEFREYKSWNTIYYDNDGKIIGRYVKGEYMEE